MTCHALVRHDFVYVAMSRQAFPRRYSKSGTLRRRPDGTGVVNGESSFLTIGATYSTERTVGGAGAGAELMGKRAQWGPRGGGGGGGTEGESGGDDRSTEFGRARGRGGGVTHDPSMNKQHCRRWGWPAVQPVDLPQNR